MYADRIRVLDRAYASAAKHNKLYDSAKKEQLLYQQQCDFLTGLQTQLQIFDLKLTEEESTWREGILSLLESEIINDLTYVFPTDGYNVKLQSRVVRGRIHIEASVMSTFSGKIPGRIRSTQGRIFQQVVSFAALIGVMVLLGIDTAYFDEAFSGSSKRNVRKLNALLEHLKQRGLNLIIIAQDTAMAKGLGANTLYFSRSVDNKTAVTQEVGAE